jgi:hypothetical protein
MYANGVKHLHVVAGSDRTEEYKKLLDKYNDGVEHKHGKYKFKSITVHSSGERDPDAEGVSGVSGTKMREFASHGKQKEFHAALPSKMKEAHKHALYTDLRKSMNLHEHIVKVGGKFRLVSKKSGKNLGTYDSKEGAIQREREVEYFKHNK